MKFGIVTVMSVSLLQLLDQSEQRLFFDACQKIQDGDVPIPLNDVVEILATCDDILYITAVIQCLVAQMEDVFDVLCSTYYPKVGDVVKRYMIIAMCADLNNRRMQFLLGEYVANEYLRPMIRKHACVHKQFLLVNLAQFIEYQTLTESLVEIVQQLLRTVPASTVRKTADALAGMTILDIYYAMPSGDASK